MKNIIILVFVLLLIGVGIWSFVSREEFDPNEIPNQDNASLSEIGEIVAIVNDEEITRSEFEELQSQMAAQQGVDVASLDVQTQTQIRSQVVDNLISQKLLQQKIEESEISVSEENITAQVDLIKQGFETDEQFQEALSGQGLTEDQLRENVASEIAVQNYLEQELNLSSLTVTEEEVAAAYEEISQSEQEEIPSLEEVYSQVENMVVQQRQQELINEFIAELRSDAEIEILI